MGAARSRRQEAVVSKSYSKQQETCYTAEVGGVGLMEATGMRPRDHICTSEHIGKNVRFTKGWKSWGTMMPRRKQGPAFFRRCSPTIS